MSERILITGAGIISSLGMGVEATFKSLREGVCGIGVITHLDTAHTEFPAGEVALSNEEMASMLNVGYPENELRTVLMGIIAAKEAVESAKLSDADIRKAAFISGTTVGGMDKTEKYFKSAFDAETKTKDSLELKYNDCGYSTELISESIGNFVMSTTTSTACSSAANAIILGAEMIKAGIVDIAVVGGAEALTKFHLNGFNTLMILDKETCRPFDRDRAGINLGEGAAYIVLENEESAKGRNITPLGVLSGYANTCDAFHQTATSENGEGAYLAMRKAMDMAHLNPRDIDYINAHGTGTPNNDACELAAMERIWGYELPAFSSTKALTGHTTSASGSIEAVICLLALQHSFIPPNLGWKNPIHNGAVPVTEIKDCVNIRHIINNSFGFGGNDSSLIFSKYSPLSLKHGRHHRSRSYHHCYINSLAQVSCQTPLSDEWLDSPVIHEEAYARAQEPDTRNLIIPSEARRMSKILKRTVSTAITALNESGIQHPDAIITGTGMGCMENSEKFLIDLSRFGESCLKPTLFMQSTHNTISSIIAIILKCHGYNNTYSHKGLSFESALYDAWLRIKEGTIRNALIGGHDEVTPFTSMVMERTHPEFSFISETSVSAIVSSNGNLSNLCEIEEVRLFNHPDPKELGAYLSKDSDGILMLGNNGNPLNDKPYDIMLAELSYTPATIRYKNIFGENFCSTAIAFYAAAKILERGSIPDFMTVTGTQAGQCMNGITIINHSDGKAWSLIRLKKSIAKKAVTDPKDTGESCGS